MASRNGEPEDHFSRERRRMVHEQIVRRGVRDPRVLAAMERVPRHKFIPGHLSGDAYGDFPVGIGQGQTVSQPYIVAYMIAALQLPAGARVLEIGTGTGYQAAVLVETGFRVWTVEVRPGLAEEADIVLRASGYGADVLQLRCGDGSEGWPEAAPFDGIMVAAAPRRVPPALLEQLAPGGTLLVPVGDDEQTLWRYRCTPAGYHGEELFAVRFVPMVSRK